MSGYILFSSEMRAVIKAQHPDYSFGELSRLVGTEWRNLEASKKAEYEGKLKAVVLKSLFALSLYPVSWKHVSVKKAILFCLCAFKESVLQCTVKLWYLCETFGSELLSKPKTTSWGRGGRKDRKEGRSWAQKGEDRSGRSKLAYVELLVEMIQKKEMKKKRLKGKTTLSLPQCGGWGINQINKNK